MKQIAEIIINKGKLEEWLNITRLLVLSKELKNVPKIDKLRPIQICDPIKLLLEALAEPEIKNLSEN